MAEKCMLCKEKMFVGDAYKIVNDMDSTVGYVHRECLYPELKEKTQPKKKDE